MIILFYSFFSSIPFFHTHSVVARFFSLRIASRRSFWIVFFSLFSFLNTSFSLRYLLGLSDHLIGFQRSLRHKTKFHEIFRKWMCLTRASARLSNQNALSFSRISRNTSPTSGGGGRSLKFLSNRTEPRKKCTKHKWPKIKITRKTIGEQRSTMKFYVVVVDDDEAPKKKSKKFPGKSLESCEMAVFISFCCAFVFTIFVMLKQMDTI